MHNYFARSEVLEGSTGVENYRVEQVIGASNNKVFRVFNTAQQRLEAMKEILVRGE
jgi:hypothetical protein